MVVDLAGAGLDNVDVFTAYRVLDLAPALPTRELAQDSVALRDTEDKIANHFPRPQF